MPYGDVEIVSVAPCVEFIPLGYCILDVFPSPGSYHVARDVCQRWRQHSVLVRCELGDSELPLRVIANHVELSITGNESSVTTAHVDRGNVLHHGNGCNGLNGVIGGSHSKVAVVVAAPGKQVTAV